MIAKEIKRLKELIEKRKTTIQKLEEMTKILKSKNYKKVTKRTFPTFNWTKDGWLIISDGYYVYEGTRDREEVLQHLIEVLEGEKSRLKQNEERLQTMKNLNEEALIKDIQAVEKKYNLPPFFLSEFIKYYRL